MSSGKSVDYAGSHAEEEMDKGSYQEEVVGCQLSVINMSSFLSDISTADIQREKNRAKELRQSQWWKRKRATGICHYCQGWFPPTELTMDHLVPLARGGKSTKGNLVLACKECNTKKKYALPWEWEREDVIRKT